MIVVSGSNDEGPPPSGRAQNIDVMDPESNTYSHVKARFERRSFKILSPFAYAHLVRDDKREPDLYTPQQFRHLFANLFFFERDVDTGEWQRVLFVTRWFADVEIRQVVIIVLLLNLASVCKV